MKCDLTHVLACALALTWPFFAGCAGVSTELLVGSKIADGGFEGTGPTATLRIRKRLNDRVFCEYEHVSHVVVDRRDEVQLDQVGCGIRFGVE